MDGLDSAPLYYVVYTAVEWKPRAGSLQSLLTQHRLLNNQNCNLQLICSPGRPAVTVTLHSALPI